MLSTAAGRSTMPISIYSIHSAFGVAARGVIVFGPVKKVLGDRMSVVPARPRARTIFDQLAHWPAVNESLASRLPAGI